MPATRPIKEVVFAEAGEAAVEEQLLLPDRQASLQVGQQAVAQSGSEALGWSTVVTSPHWKKEFS